MNENVIPMRIEGGEIQVKATLGQTVIKVVAPDEYTGATTVTPSSETQVLETKDRLVPDDITVNPAPTETLSTTSNGTFTPSDGMVGFSQVDVNVQPDLRPLSVSENGSYQPDGFDGYSDVTVDVPAPAPVTESLSVTENGTYVPPTGVDGFDEVVVDVPTGGFPSYDDVVLPSEYQRVEYIESSGTQYINLPYGFAPTDTISFRGANNQYTIDDKYLVAPTRWNDDSNRFALLGNNRSSLNNNRVACFGYGSKPTGTTWYYEQVDRDSNFHTIDYSNKVSIIDRGLGAIGVGNIPFGAETADLRLFYGYNSNTAGKICYYIHEKADNRKIALFACYRKSDGVIGMYDIENDVFYTNNGTGDFTKGQDI